MMLATPTAVLQGIPKLHFLCFERFFTKFVLSQIRNWTDLHRIVIYLMGSTNSGQVKKADTRKQPNKHHNLERELYLFVEDFEEVSKRKMPMRVRES